MRTTIRAARFLVIVGLAVSSLLHTAPAAAAPHGKVWLLVNPQAAREDWQRRPLSGAFVVLDWTVTVPGPASAVAYCRYSELARTNDQGEYEMEGPNLLTALAADVSFFAYSPGLEVIAFRYPGSRMLPQDITMTMSTRTAQQRLSWLAQVSRPGCPAPEPSDPRALFVPYLRALLDEANMLVADSPAGRSNVESIEAALRHATGLDRSSGMRVRVLPAPAAIEAAPPARAASGPGPQRPSTHDATR
jgi:hypothetical protein